MKLKRQRILIWKPERKNINITDLTGQKNSGYHQNWWIDLWVVCIYHISNKYCILKSWKFKNSRDTKFTIHILCINIVFFCQFKSKCKRWKGLNMTNTEKLTEQHFTYFYLRHIGIVVWAINTSVNFNSNHTLFISVFKFICDICHFFALLVTR